MGLAWPMRIERWDPADETTAMACHEVHRAAHVADEADDPPFSAGTFGLYLRQGFDKTPGEVGSPPMTTAGWSATTECSCTTWRT